LIGENRCFRALNLHLDLFLLARIGGLFEFSLRLTSSYYKLLRGRVLKNKFQNGHGYYLSCRSAWKIFSHAIPWQILRLTKTLDHASASFVTVMLLGLHELRLRFRAHLVFVCFSLAFARTLACASLALLDLACSILCAAELFLVPVLLNTYPMWFRFLPFFKKP